MKKLLIIMCFFIFACLSLGNVQVMPSQSFFVTYNKISYEIKFNNKSESNIHTIKRQSEKFSRNKSMYLKAQTISELVNFDSSLENAFNIVCKDEYFQIKKVIAKICKNPTDAKISLNPYTEEFSFKNEVYGVGVNESVLLADIVDAILNGKNKTEVKIFKIKPKYLLEDIKKSIYARSMFFTNIEHSTPERKHNIELSLKKFNGMVIYPNDVVSFNKVTGKRNEATGYKTAKVIQNGAFIDGVGGGVCQASTTLYNALLLADVEVLQSRGHSLPVRYVPSGLDAMVSEYSGDLVFKNTSSLPISIKVEVSDKFVMVKVFGQNLNDLVVKLETEIIEELPPKPDMFIYDTEGEYADKVTFKTDRYVARNKFDGFKTQSYLVYYKNGIEISRKKVRKTTYESQGELVVAGVL